MNVETKNKELYNNKFLIENIIFIIYISIVILIFFWFFIINNKTENNQLKSLMKYYLINDETLVSIDDNKLDETLVSIDDNKLDETYLYFYIVTENAEYNEVKINNKKYFLLLNKSLQILKNLLN